MKRLFLLLLLLAGLPVAIRAQGAETNASVRPYGPVIMPVPGPTNAPANIAPAAASDQTVITPATNAPAEVAPAAAPDQAVITPATNAPASVSDQAPAITSPPPTQVPPEALPSMPGTAASQQDEIKDIRPPLFFLHSWLWLWITLGAVAALALLVLLWNWLRSPSMLNPRTAYDLALEKLEKARALLNEEEPVPYAVFVSETIRTYLGQRFLAPSTRRTTEEFLHQMEIDEGAPLAGHRDLLRDFLQSCDLVKFARYQPTLTELEQVQDRAVTFVTATKPEPASAGRNGRHP